MWLYVWYNHINIPKTSRLSHSYYFYSLIVVWLVAFTYTIFNIKPSWLQIQIVCLCLQGVFSLKKSFFEPRYILLFPNQVEKYKERLKSRGLYTPAQIEMAVSRIELYAKTSRQRPGFFDNVISCGMARKHYILDGIWFNILQCLIQS